MKVVIDLEICHGHGRCYALAPDVFEPDDRGHGLVVSGDLSEDLRGHAEIAAANCPERAITVTG